MIAPVSIAYVFWHSPRPQVDTGHYENALRDFHDVLAAAGIAGFQRSWTVMCRDPLPWGDFPYQDHYLVTDFGALGALNDMAARTPAHDVAASGSAAGTAGVYGVEDPDPDAQWAQWFAKPPGMDYARVRSTVAEPALWQRQLTLGPAPEFLVTGRERRQLPFDTVDVRLRRV